MILVLRKRGLSQRCCCNLLPVFEPDDVKVHPFSESRENLAVSNQDRSAKIRLTREIRVLCSLRNMKLYLGGKKVPKPLAAIIAKQTIKT
jgi:hypothetical protein